MAFFSKSLRNWTKKHDFIEGLTEWSPTEYAELTEFTAEFFPQNTQNSQNLLLSILPQISQKYTEFTAEFSPTDFRNTPIVRVRIIKTTKYAHVKDGEVADSIAVEHNVLATFFPTLFHRRRTESNRTANGNQSDGGRKPIGRRTRTVAHLGGALVSSAPTEQEIHQPSKNCANRARAAPTEQELHPLQAPSVVTFSHRTHRTHRIYCCVFSHRFHGNTQIVRVQKNKNNGLSG